MACSTADDDTMVVSTPTTKCLPAPALKLRPDSPPAVAGFHNELHSRCSGEFGVVGELGPDSMAAAVGGLKVSGASAFMIWKSLIDREKTKCSEFRSHDFIEASTHYVEGAHSTTMVRHRESILRLT